MLYLVKVKVVFVIIVGGLVVVQIGLQVGFQLGVGVLGGQHIAVLGKVRGRRDAGSGTSKHGGAGLQAADNQKHQKPQHQNGQRPFPVAPHKGGRPFAFLGGCLGRLGGGPGCCLGRALRRCACGLARCPGGLGVLALDLLFLPHPGNGVTGCLCDLRVIPQGLLVEILRVGGQ